MVAEEAFQGKATFLCEVCGFHYESRERAAQCEQFCKEHNACDPEIIQNALENQTV